MSCLSAVQPRQRRCSACCHSDASQLAALPSSGRDAAATATLLSLLSQRCFSACCGAVFRERVVTRWTTAGGEKAQCHVCCYSDARHLAAVPSSVLARYKRRGKRERLPQWCEVAVRSGVCTTSQATVAPGPGWPLFVFSHALQRPCLPAMLVSLMRCRLQLSLRSRGEVRERDYHSVTGMLLSLLRCSLQEATVAPGWPLFAFLMHCSLVCAPGAGVLVHVGSLAT